MGPSVSPRPPRVAAPQSILSNSNHSSIGSYLTPAYTGHRTLWCGQGQRRTSWCQRGDLSTDISPDATVGLPRYNSWIAGSNCPLLIQKLPLFFKLSRRWTRTEKLMCYLPDECSIWFEGEHQQVYTSKSVHRSWVLQHMWKRLYKAFRGFRGRCLESDKLPQVMSLESASRAVELKRSELTRPL